MLRKMSLAPAALLTALCATTTADAGPGCPWDCEMTPDGMVGTPDFLALLSQWSVTGSCDFDGGSVGTTDFLELLANWGPCPVPVNDECVDALLLERSDATGTVAEPFDLAPLTASIEEYACLKQAGGTFKDAWFCLSYTGVLPTTTTITTSNNVFLEVYEGCACPPGPLLGCQPGDGMDPVSFSVMPGEQFLIRVIDDEAIPPDQLAGDLTIVNGPVPDVAFFLDPSAFFAAVAATGAVEKFTWDFQPNDLPGASLAVLDDPLDINTHGDDVDDPWGELWPADVDNVQFASNQTPPAPLDPRMFDGLLFMTAGFVPELTNDALAANFFDDSFNVVSGPPAGDTHIAMGLELVSVGLAGQVPVLFRVSVFDKDDVERAAMEIPADSGEKVFLGILTNGDVTIGRVDVWDMLAEPAMFTGAEGVSSIATFTMPTP